MIKIPVITLTTDFGISDGYTGSVKGAILSINTGACIVDIRNNVEPQNIYQASFLIKTVYEYFPLDSIHLVIVDPGVGGGRKAIIMKAAGRYFIAPDNGILTYVIGDYFPELVHRKDLKIYSLHKARIPSSIKVYEISDPSYWRKNVSTTFHGRDIFGPVAAHLGSGVTVSKLGKRINSVYVFNVPEPAGSGGHINGRVIYVDHFGNLVTNIREQDLTGSNFQIKIAGTEIKGISKYYAQKTGLSALIGSSGYLEIACRNGSAAESLKASFDETVELIPY